MKRIIIAATALCALLLTVGCNDTVERTTFGGPEYVMFQDTLSENYVTSTGTISVTVAATKATSYDRTFGVEVVAKGSTAIENRHYNLVSDNITIKAGELATNVEIQPHFEAFSTTDSLGVVLRLVQPEVTEWELYTNTTKVTFTKHCDFDMAVWMDNEKRALDPEKYNYANYIFYVTFPYSSNTTQFSKALVKVVADPTNPNALIIKEPFQLNKDLKIVLAPGVPGDDFVTVGAQLTFASSNYGWITMASYANYPSYFDSCRRYIELYLNCYAEGAGTFGIFPYYLEWITERHAEEIRNNGF